MSPSGVKAYRKIEIDRYYAPVIFYQCLPTKKKNPTEMVGDGRAKVQANWSLFVPAVPGF